MAEGLPSIMKPRFNTNNRKHPHCLIICLIALAMEVHLEVSLWQTTEHMAVGNEIVPLSRVLITCSLCIFLHVFIWGLAPIPPPCFCDKPPLWAIDTSPP